MREAASGSTAFYLRRAGASLLVSVSMLVAAGDAAASGPSYTQQGAFTGATSAFFGYAVAMDGNTAVVGAFNDNAGKGEAYVYVLSGSSWGLQASLTAADGAAGDEFGYQVAVSGNTILVGAAGKANGQGYVYAFARTGSTWALQQEFTSSDGTANDCYGCALALSGLTAVVGAPGRLGGTGAAYMVTSGTSWQQQNEFLGTGSSDSFGFSVGLSPDGTTAIVGAFGVATETGAAYVFTENGAWSSAPTEATITATGGQAHDRFGYAVGAGSGEVLVGAYGAGGTGRAYVFSGSGTSWPEQAVLTASDGASGDAFGFAVAINGNMAVIGAYEKATANGPGAAYVFTTSGSAWSQTELLPMTAGSYFGYDVALSGANVAVGAFGAASDSGAVYFFAPGGAHAVPAFPTAVGWCMAFLLAGAGVAALRRRESGGLA